MIDKYWDGKAMNINLSMNVTDNVEEVLVKILEFTKSRHAIITENISNIHTPGYVPMDLTVEEFAELMDEAINEHKRSRKLLLRDTEAIKFGFNGTFEARPVVDEYAKKLFENNNISQYVQFQMQKLLENLLNQKIASEMLKQKEGVVTGFID